MNRADLRFHIESAFTAGRPDYARALCLQWLALAPGDLAIRFALARALAAEGHALDALAELDTITQSDVEHAAAYRLTATLSPSALDSVRATALAHIVTGTALPSGMTAPLWMEPARQAVVLLGLGQFDSARDQIDIALRHDSTHPLLSLILLKTHWLAGEVDLALPLAKGFHDRWPKVVPFMLCLAEGLIRHGSSPEAVAVLHTAGTLDAGEDVVSRYWSDVHPYRDLWPQPPSATVPGPMPPEVAALLGLNRLPPGPLAEAKGEAPPARSERVRPVRPVQQFKKGSAATAKSRLESDLRTPPETDPPEAEPTPVADDRAPLPEPAQPKSTLNPVAEELRDIQWALSKIASQIGSGRAQRKPVHVILFSPKLLEAKFGPQGAEQVLGLIGQLGKATAKNRRVTVSLLAPDAPAPEFKLQPINPANPWDVKMMLHDYDRQLIAKGQTIGSLLIIGGDDLMPFHRLPNPTDDADEIIPSDNPYATSDDNYFIPEYPVGRLPSPCGRDPEPLCRLIHHTIAAHQSGGGAKFLGGLLEWLATQWRKPALPASVGYSASVWKQASAEVFAPIGGGDRLSYSPPLESATAPALNRARLSYFNLHGVEDGPNWFGQRDEADGYGPLYPLALEPRDASKEALPKVIFTEACYGANILNKAEPDAALSLRFLNDGVCAFVGSTKIAYGSVASPLIGADLLGRMFWENLLAGFNVGESLRRAKLQVAQAMHKRQHFLDGEDQKTLISFVLYGDPLLPVFSAAAKARFGKQAKSLPQVKTVAMEYESGDEDEMQPGTVSEIKALLSRYLPGSESAEVSISRPLSPIGAKGKTAPTHRVYTILKTMRYGSHTIPTYARVTVNKAGKVVKVAVSR